MEAISALVAINTIAKTAQTVCDIGKALYKLVHGASLVDQTVEDLHAEVKGLSDTCNLAHRQLQGLCDEYAVSASDDHLWRCFVEQAKECDRTIAQLSCAIGSNGKLGKNPLRRAWRQMELQMSAAEIEAMRSRVRSHTSSLQTILLTINIKVSNLSPRLANQELVTKIGVLTDMVERLQNVNSFGKSTLSPGQQLETVRKTIVQYAQEVVSDSTTLYAESIAGGSDVDPKLSAANEEDYLTAWIRDLDVRDIAKVPLVRQPTPSPKTSGPSIARKPVASVSTSPFSMNRTDNADLEDEMAIETARASCQLGTNAMKAGNYQEADEFLKEGASLLQAVPSHLREKAVYLYGLQFQMAVCTFHTGKPQEAVDALLQVVQREARDDTERVSICTASHLLSQAYIKIGKVELARQSCEQALQGRRTLLGKKHRLYQESVALMARVFELQGNIVRAKVFLGMLDVSAYPDDAKFATLFQNLNLPDLDERYFTDQSM